jgi:hypothetical protein
MSDTFAPFASVHVGPKGGVEFRAWTGADTYRVVGKFAAWPMLSDAERDKANAMSAERKARKASADVNAQWWRDVRRGG